MSKTAADADAALREQIESLLDAGLPTHWRDRADNGAKVRSVVAELQRTRPDELARKLQIAGFTITPYAAAGDEVPQSCASCMYYLVHRRFCALPELALPVQAEWSCRLWRI